MKGIIVSYPSNYNTFLFFLNASILSSKVCMIIRKRFLLLLKAHCRNRQDEVM